MGPIRVLGTAYLRLTVDMPASSGQTELGIVGKDLGLGVRPSYPAHVTRIPELKARLQGQQYTGAEILAVKLIPLPVHHCVKNQDFQQELPRPSGRGDNNSAST